MKGRDAEQDAVGLYEDAGYEVYLPPQAKYREQDIFGEWDILAFGHGRLEAVQVKAGRDAAGIQKWFETNRVYEANLDDLRLTFMHHTDTGWRLARSTREGYEWVYDGRNVGDSDRPGLKEVLQA